MTTEQATPHNFETPPGGIMTQEVGAITGPVEAWIEGDRVHVRYAGAAETYRVEGSVGERSPDQVWDLLTTDPGLDADDNPLTVDLTRRRSGD